MYYSTIRLCGWIVLFCAVILGRYYTDYHDVDEEIVTIVLHGAGWYDSTSAGVTLRCLFRPYSHISVNVASSNMQKYRIIRISTMSTRTTGLFLVTGNVGVVLYMRVCVCVM